MKALCYKENSKLINIYRDGRPRSYRQPGGSTQQLSCSPPGNTWPSAFPRRRGGGPKASSTAGVQKKWQGTSISTINWRTIVFLMFSMLSNHNHFNLGSCVWQFQLYDLVLGVLYRLFRHKRSIVTLESRLKRSNPILLIADSNVTIVPFMVE